LQFVTNPLDSEIAVIFYAQLLTFGSFYPELKKYCVGEIEGIEPPLSCAIHPHSRGDEAIGADS
jgi:hypothetical protein